MQSKVTFGRCCEESATLYSRVCGVKSRLRRRRAAAKLVVALPLAQQPVHQALTTKLPQCSESSINPNQLADRRYTDHTATRGTRRTPLPTANYLDRMSHVQAASSGQKVGKA